MNMNIPILSKTDDNKDTNGGTSCTCRDTILTRSIDVHIQLCMSYHKGIMIHHSIY